MNFSSEPLAVLQQEVIACRQCPRLVEYIAGIGRVKRRGVPEAISVQPVLDTEGRVADALAKPMNDYLVVLKLPSAQ